MEAEEITEKKSDLSSEELEKIFLSGTPFVYLLENAEFYHNNFYINSSVLIPRPETEYLVDMVVQEQSGKIKRVLDVGTGSGVILLSLLSHAVGEFGVGVDISQAALEVARKNAEKLRLSEKASFLLSDRLNKVEGTFDLIISNPPYIKSQSHRNLVHDQVHNFEPHEALYLPDDFYVFWFEDFFHQIRSHLKGSFYMEGHELELDSHAIMLERLGFKEIRIINDLSGMKRFIKAKFE